MGLFSPRSTVLFKDYADYGIDGNHCSITIKECLIQEIPTSKLSSKLEG